jgi:O-antigen ligase
MYAMGMITALMYPRATAADFAEVQGTLHTPILLAQLIIYSFGSILLLSRWRRIVGATQKMWPILIVIAMVPTSAVWSVDPMLTLRRSVLFLASAAFAIYLGDRYSPRQFATILLQALTINMIASALLFIVAPVYVLDQDSHAGAWKGLSEQKNAFGANIALAVLLLSLIRFRKYNWLRYALLMLALAELALSRCSTGLSACVVSMAALPLMKLIRLPARLRIPAYILSFAMLLAACGIVASNADVLFRLLGRDATLTGRTDIWAALVTAVKHRPILGYGYDAFWTGLKGESLNVIIASGWLVPEAHNGYLELCIEFGCVGLGIFFLAFGNTWRQACRFIRSEAGAFRYWPLAFLIYLLTHNLGESDLMGKSSLSLFVFLSLCTSLASQNRRAAVDFEVAAPAGLEPEGALVAL